MQLQSGLDDPLRRRFRRRVPLEQLVDDAGAEFGRRGAILGATDANEVGADEAVVASELDERLEEFGAGAVVQETALARTMAGRPARLEREIGVFQTEQIFSAVGVHGGGSVHRLDLSHPVDSRHLFCAKNEYQQSPALRFSKSTLL